MVFLKMNGLNRTLVLSDFIKMRCGMFLMQGNLKKEMNTKILLARKSSFVAVLTRVSWPTFWSTLEKQS
jgi:hypothetical protein